MCLRRKTKSNNHNGYEAKTSIPKWKIDTKPSQVESGFCSESVEMSISGVERIQDLDSSSVDMMPGPSVELDAPVARQDDQIEVRRIETS